MQTNARQSLFPEAKETNIYNVNVVFVYFATKPSAEKGESTHVIYHEDEKCWQE